ncbi:MAG: hypothetical protein LC635_01390 [Pseudonocardiaceae bacterium]|nr:hypothetical protein [Pseudonocardiaceae bacterium]
MDGFTTNPAALRAKAGYDEQRAGVIDSLKQQIARARITEDCFGLIGMNAGFATGYDNMVDDVDENVGKAAEYLRSSADRLTASADQYDVIELGWVTSMGKAESAMADNTFSTASPSAAVRPGVDTVDAAKNLGQKVSDFQDASSLPETFVAGVGLKRGVDHLLSHPMQGFWDNGLGFLVEWCMYPLRPLFEQVTGDPDQLRATGAGWEKMAGFVTSLADADATEQTGLGKYWQGPAATAQDRQNKEFQDGLRSLADCCRQLKKHLNQVAEFFEGLWNILVNIVRELVEGLIVTWLAALATSAISFGSSVAAAWSVTVARFSVTLSRILLQISKALKWLVKAAGWLKKLQTAIRDLIKSQGMMVRMGAHVLGVHHALRFLDPTAVLVRGATGLTGWTPARTALRGGRELATDTVLREVGEEVTGEDRRGERNQEAMDRGFS